MEILKINPIAEDKIAGRGAFIVDNITPLAIMPLIDNIYRILFKAEQNSTEEVLYPILSFRITNNNEQKYIENHELNYTNSISINKEKFDIFNDTIQGDIEELMLETDMKMVEIEKKPYFICQGYKSYNNGKSYDVIELLFSRDCFIRINIFFNRLQSLNTNSVDNIFKNHKLNHIKFSTINHVKLEGSATTTVTKLVYNHYIVGNGPEIYRFNFISKKLDNMKLKCPMSLEIYDRLYSECYNIIDMIYEEVNDCLYVIYEDRSDITYSYKGTKALRFYKDMYEKTNLIDATKIYEKEVN